MFELAKTFRFEAGHSLTYHDGKCRDPHGHSYILTIIIKSEQLVESGCKKNMVMDFSDISSAVNALIETHLDHKWLNDTLESDSPTAEYIARWIFHRLEPAIPHLHAIEIFETASSKVTYSRF